jgi:hypothetical protein
MGDVIEVLDATRLAFVEAEPDLALAVERTDAASDLSLLAPSRLLNGDADARGLSMPLSESLSDLILLLTRPRILLLELSFVSDLDRDGWLVRAGRSEVEPLPFGVLTPSLPLLLWLPIVFRIRPRVGHPGILRRALEGCATFKQIGMSRQGGFKIANRQRSMRIACQVMYCFNTWLEKGEKDCGRYKSPNGLTMPRRAQTFGKQKRSGERWMMKQYLAGSMLKDIL